MTVLMIISGVSLLVLGVLYFKTAQDIERDDINEAVARAQRFKNKRASNELAGA